MNSRLLFPGGVVVGLCGVKHLAGLAGHRLGGVSGVSGIVVCQLRSGEYAGEYAGGAGGGGGGCKE